MAIAKGMLRQLVVFIRGFKASLLINLVGILSISSLFLDHKEAMSEPMVQMVYGGSMVAGVEAPPGWSYVQASREQEKTGVLALYSLNGISMYKAWIYVTLIPVEQRKPRSLSEEIELDKMVSKRDGLKLMNTLRSRNNSGADIAINTWQSKNKDKQFVGIYPTKSGVFMACGVSSSKDLDGKVAKGVRDITEHTKWLQNFVVQELKN